MEIKKLIPTIDVSIFIFWRIILDVGALFGHQVWADDSRTQRPHTKTERQAKPVVYVLQDLRELHRGYEERQKAKLPLRSQVKEWEIDEDR